MKRVAWSMDFSMARDSKAVPAASCFLIASASAGLATTIWRAWISSDSFERLSCSW